MHTCLWIVSWEIAFHTWPTAAAASEASHTNTQKHHDVSTHTVEYQKSKNVRVPQISTKDRDKHLLIVNKTFFLKIEYTFKEQIQTTELIFV